MIAKLLKLVKSVTLYGWLVLTNLISIRLEHVCVRKLLVEVTARLPTGSHLVASVIVKISDRSCKP